MAITLQSASLSEPFEYISLTDKALDGEAEDFAEAFRRYREGGPRPPLKDGMEPTVWELTPITDAELNGKLKGIRVEHGNTSWFIAIACVGITGVSGLKDEKGRKFSLCRARNADGHTVVGKAQQDRIGVDILEELGMALATHNIPPQT